MNTWKRYYDRFFMRIENDPYIRSGHLAVFTAILYLWTSKQQDSKLYAYSKEVMAIAKISSKITYLRIINELSEYGYIKYRPSLSKYYPSEIGLLGIKNKLRKRRALICGKRKKGRANRAKYSLTN